MVTVRDKSGEHRVEAGVQDWRPGTTTLGEETARPVAAWGAWPQEDTYAMNVCFRETPFAVTLTAHFSENTAHLTLHQNVSFGPTERPPLEGHAS